MTEPRTVVWFSAGAPSAVVAKLTIDTTEYPPEGQNVECDVHEAFADALAKNHFALNYCPKCGEKL